MPSLAVRYEVHVKNKASEIEHSRSRALSNRSGSAVRPPGDILHLRHPCDKQRDRLRGTHLRDQDQDQRSSLGPLAIASLQGQPSLWVYSFSTQDRPAQPIIVSNSRTKSAVTNSTCSRHCSLSSGSPKTLAEPRHVENARRHFSPLCASTPWRWHVAKATAYTRHRACHRIVTRPFVSFRYSLHKAVAELEAAESKEA